MNAKFFLKWGAISICTLFGLVYAASCLLVAEQATRFLWAAVGTPVSRLFAWKAAAPWLQGRLPFFDGSFLKVEIWREAQLVNSTPFFNASFIKGGIEIILFLVLLALPLFIAYRFLIRPIRQFQLIYPETLRDLEEAKHSGIREDAADALLNCMLSAPESVMDEDERVEIQQNLCCTDEKKADFALEILARRKAKAKARAVEIAKMAGLTVAASSSGIGDGLGMFFWKSKLVYETFRIYGFRPSLRATADIYLHVVFASLFAASLEELSDLLGVSDFLGGLGGRLLQGGAGMAMVIKGGYLTRAYLTQGISETTRKAALDQFRSDATKEFQGIGDSVAQSLKAIGELA